MCWHPIAGANTTPLGVHQDATWGGTYAKILAWSLGGDSLLGSLLWQYGAEMEKIS